MNQYTFKDFVDGKISLNVEKNDFRRFCEECDRHDLRWLQDCRMTQIGNCVREAFYSVTTRSWGKEVWPGAAPIIVRYRDLLPAHTFQDVLDGKVGVRCETRDEYDRLMREFEARGLKWCAGGEKPTEWAGHSGYGPTVFSVWVFEHSKTLCTSADRTTNCVPFSAIFPADPWADFVAGKCYLRVTKAEWPEFAKRCEAAGMRGVDAQNDDTAVLYRACSTCQRPHRIYNPLDSCPIYDFTTIARPAEPAPEAKPYDGRGKHKVGDLFEVILPGSFEVGDIIALERDDESDCPWFKRVSDGYTAYKQYKRLKPYTAPASKIIITCEGSVTTARLYEGDKVVKSATATRGPDDAFSFETGARLAFNRLIPGSIRELRVRLTSAFDAAIKSVHAALRDLPNHVEVSK